MSVEKEKSSNKLSVFDRITDVLWYILMCVVVIGAAHYGRRIFIAERFNVPSDSMRPTLLPGDKVWVNKLLYGARIYKSFNFEDHAPLKCFRMPGFRKIRPGDVICFNYPLGYDKWTEIEFKINYVYCKRVVGVPGDTVGIKDGITWNNNYEGVLGSLKYQTMVQNTPDSILWANQMMMAMPFSYPWWTIKNLGPLYIPEKGATVSLDQGGRSIYGPVIRYETGSLPSEEMESYTFKNNYYFAFGDYSIDSKDSRYFGFIPEDFIIGIVAGKKVKNNPNQTY
ncbi:MAG: signal peptidase I [Bacteroidaceae bacterium]|nr:signal peptidase I [Bacteroidaceae bacterium]